MNAWFNKARALYEAGRPEEALHTMAEAAKLSPAPSAVASSLVNLACTLAALGRYSEALEKYELAINMEPNRSWLYFSAAEKVGNYEKIQIYNKFLSLADTNPEYHARIYEAKKRIKNLKKAGGV